MAVRTAVEPLSEARPSVRTAAGPAAEPLTHAVAVREAGVLSGVLPPGGL